MLGDDALSVDVRPLHSTHSFTVDVFGRNGPDEILGSTYDGTTFPYYTETLDGEAQDDYLEGRGGTVTLFGGLDNDELIGGDAIDFLHGDAGADILEGGGAPDFLYGGSENDTISGDGGNDLCWGEDGADTIHGNDGNDTLRGGNGADYLYGDNGTDTLLGDADMDVLYGGNDADKLDGGTALDALYGDAGNDKLCETSGNTGTFSGGAGADIVKFIPPSGTPGVIGSDSDNNLTCTQSYVTGGGTGCSSVLSNGNSFWSTVSCSP